MKRNPLWILAVFFGMTGVFAFTLPFWPFAKGLPINWPFLCAIGITGYAAILAYSFFAVNQDIAQKEFSKLADKDKYLDLLEDNLELVDQAKRIYWRAEKNVEKLHEIGKQLFPKSEAPK